MKKFRKNRFYEIKLIKHLICCTNLLSESHGKILTVILELHLLYLSKVNALCD